MGKTCGHRDPDKCILLQDIFVYMVNWVEDWACGTLNDQYCGYGEQYVNKWSLCASRDSEEDEGAEIEELAELILEEETSVEGNATSTEVEEAVEPEDLKGSS